MQKRSSMNNQFTFLEKFNGKLNQITKHGKLFKIEMNNKEVKK
jgi:hypothetical protein